jgi:hypothetical protein
VKRAGSPASVLTPFASPLRLGDWASACQVAKLANVNPGVHEVQKALPGTRRG